MLAYRVKKKIPISNMHTFTLLHLENNYKDNLRPTRLMMMTEMDQLTQWTIPLLS